MTASSRFVTSAVAHSVADTFENNLNLSPEQLKSAFRYQLAGIVNDVPQLSKAILLEILLGLLIRARDIKNPEFLSIFAPLTPQETFDFVAMSTAMRNLNFDMMNKLIADYRTYLERNHCY